MLKFIQLKYLKKRDYDQAKQPMEIPAFCPKGGN